MAEDGLTFGQVAFGPTPTFRTSSTRELPFHEKPGPVFLVGPARFMTIDAFAAISGYTSSAIRSKKAEGIWREGKEYVIAPDGRILVDVEGYNKWVQGRQ